MRPPILVGIALGVLILAAALVAPSLRSSQRKSADKARELATLAERQLARYSQALPRAEELAAVADFKQKEEAVGAAVAAASGELKKLTDEYAKLARTAQQQAAKYGLPAPALPPLMATADGIMRSAATLRESLKANEDLLEAAAGNAQAAVQADPNALPGSQALGLAEYIRAANGLAVAHAARVRQADAQARLRDVAALAAAARSHRDHFRGLEVAQIVSQLQVDLTEISRLREQAATDVAQLARQVQEREQKLIGVEQTLQQVSAERSRLEELGFSAGDDSSFQRYRERFLGLTQRLGQLESQFHELRYGGQVGAELTGDDPTIAELVGGTPTLSFDDLKQHLASAEERARRLASATLALEAQVKFVTSAGDTAAAGATHYQQVLSDLDSVQHSIVVELKKLATDGFNAEEEALGAANKSIKAFGQAQRNADNWQSALRKLQQAKDPGTKNDRLRIVTRDVYLEHVARSAEAAAQVLAGRIYAQRVDGAQTLIDDMRALAELNPDFQFDATPFETQLDAARSAGLETVGKAADTYTKIAAKLASQPTVWVPLAALAATQQLLGRLDAAHADEYAAKAEKVLVDATKMREQFPYAQMLVQFRDHLSRAKAPPPAAPTEKAEDKDFFLDDENE